MNEYGRMALDHWMRWLPLRYSQIDDPNSFFSILGIRAAERIADLTLELAGQDPPGEQFMQKLGRLNNAAQRAREMVLPEMVLLEPEPQTGQVEPDPEPQQPADNWVPMRQDPNHPWWQEAMAEEATRRP